jgi:transketolase
LSDSFDGPTHHSITDMAIMRSLPNMTVVVPSDGVAIDKLLPQVAEWQGPVYFRLNRNDVPVIFNDSYMPVIGRAHQVLAGEDLTIFANGLMLARSLEAAEQLATVGIAARVVEMHTVKPLDVDGVVRAAEETGAIVTAEEHSIIGGLGGALAEVLSEQRPVPLKRVGIGDRFAETGPYAALLDRYGMAVADIVAAARHVVNVKSGAKKVYA